MGIVVRFPEPQRCQCIQDTGIGETHSIKGPDTPLHLITHWALQHEQRDRPDQTRPGAHSPWLCTSCWPTSYFVKGIHVAEDSLVLRMKTEDLLTHSCQQHGMLQYYWDATQPQMRDSQVLLLPSWVGWLTSTLKRMNSEVTIDQTRQAWNSEEGVRCANWGVQQNMHLVSSTPKGLYLATNNDVPRNFRLTTGTACPCLQCFQDSSWGPEERRPIVKS